jgi:hypothetical protein
MLRLSRRSGRISFVTLAGVASALLIGLLFVLSGQSPAGAAGQFMSALATGNPKKLAEYSIVGDKSPADVQKAWEQTVDYARNFRFRWEITGVSQDGEKAVVKLDYTKTPDAPQAYAEHYELELHKVGGKWKVDVPQIARDMYPYLPR